MNYGTLYGVGVGPGDPELMTLRAVKVLKSVPVIAIPRGSEQSTSLAWRIAEPNVGAVEGQERLFLTFPMTTDPDRLRSAWDAAFAEIGSRLEAGRDVAFITEGDPLVFSTFIHLLNEAPVRWPGIRIEVIPAVSSITAAPAAIGMPLADDQDRIAILPATCSQQELSRILGEFDSTVLLKVSSNMPKVVKALEEQGLLHQAVHVSKATMPQEKVIRDVRSLRNERCDYFSLVVVSRKAPGGRAGEAQSPGAIAQRKVE